MKEEWFRREGDYKFLSDTAFWAALRPYDDVTVLGKAVNHCELYVFAERPKAAFLPTRAWLRNNAGVELNKDRIIMQALKRYDCRVLGIDAFIDTNLGDLENLKIETIHPIRTYLLDRERETLSDLVKRVEHDEGMCL